MSGNKEWPKDAIWQAAEKYFQSGFCFSGAKAQFIFESLTARLKAVP